MYRPKEWEETLRGILDSFGVTYMNSEECKLVEAGADAMLGAMIKYIDETFGYDYSGVRTRELLGKE